MKSGTARTLSAAILAPVIATALAACGSSGGGSADNAITLSYSQVVADELPLWIADEAGLFKAHGVDVKLVSLNSSDGFPALISGQTQMASIGASEMVSGAGSGADVRYLATLTPVFPYELFAKVNDPQQLRGKRVGVTSTSGSLYVATLAALRQVGLQPTDVQLTPLGSVTNVNNALVAGTIDAAMSHPPATTAIEAAGFKPIVDLAKQNIPTSNVGIAATAEYVTSHGDQVRRFMAALQEAIKREKTDEAYASRVLAAHLHVTDPQAIKETYQYYAGEILPDVPTPRVAQLQTSVDELRPTVPGVQGLDLTKIVDASFLAPAR
jgi:NitT/TauT family transport system substrate-binding protein